MTAETLLAFARGPALWASLAILIGGPLGLVLLLALFLATC